MNSGYKYNISINVVPVIEYNLDLDYIDLIIFDFIKDFANSDKCTKIQTNNGLYFWISHTSIMNQLPLLRITSKAGIIKRIENLVNAGILEKSPQSQEFGKSLYRFGKNYDKMIFSDSKPEKSGLNKSIEGSKQKYRGGLNESIEDNNIYNNNIYNNKDNNIYREFKHLKITDDEFKKLIDAGYSKKVIDDVLDRIENYKNNNKYSSLYLTAKNWLQKETKKEDDSKGPNFITVF